GRARCEALDAEGARLGAAQAALDDARAQLAARRAEAEGEQREALNRAAALAEEVHKVEVRQAQVEAELGSARRRMEEEFGISFERAVEAVPESVNRDETVGRIEALRGLIAATGPVNLLAIEEHRQVAERAQALRSQMEDVQGAIAALRTLIVQLEGVIRGQFDKTYHAVNEEFGAIFARLFGGGRAGLELVPSADGAEPGIDIIAQPPGKKLRSLGALSGGERVMVALALVFAMLRVRPSPFCVFDEVEAALDEANTRKVSEVLRELAARSQIIIITHNKATMEASDALFGVTMEEPGVSHMVSVRLVESDPLGEPQPVG
ncbi:MAG TPA: AAA family ATPase, partial [bacterium]|nr:AAA family ATPase [bacterium]